MARNERIDKDTDNRQFLIFNILKLIQNSKKNGAFQLNGYQK
jgi:hypothetical protein